MPTALPERHNSTLNEEHFDAYDGIDLASSHESSGPPPSYTDTLVPFDWDIKRKPGQDTSLGDSPAQLPFDDLVGASSSSPTRRSLPVPPPSQQLISPPMASSSVEQRSHSLHESHVHNPPQSSHERSAIPHPRSRPELPHAPRSAPDPRGQRKLEHITELEEVDPFGYKFHQESTFEAARRAQREDDRIQTEASGRGGQAYTNGRMPSVKPGEIMPVYAMQPTHGQPTFLPPLEAPPFPPNIHPPIRAAHFPPNPHPPPSAPELTRASSRRYPISPPPLQPSRSHSHRRQPSPPRPPQPSRSHSHRQPPQEPLQSYSHHGTTHTPPSQPPYPYAPPLAPPSLQQEYPPDPPSRRNTYNNARDGIPPGLTPNGRYPDPDTVPQSAPLPHMQPHPQARGPPSRTPSQHQLQQPPLPTLREPQRRSLPASPSELQFAPSSVSSVRLPSQNVSTLQTLGIVPPSPAPSGSPRPDASRPPRPTPKPVMPQLLAPHAGQEYSFGRGGTGQLQRSASSMPVEKSGFLSKTKSILRKRNSSAGIKTHADGGISFVPQPGVSKRYENHAPSLESGGREGNLGKRLSKKK